MAKYFRAQCCNADEGRAVSTCRANYGLLQDGINAVGLGLSGGAVCSRMSIFLSTVSTSPAMGCRLAQPGGVPLHTSSILATHATHPLIQLGCGQRAGKSGR